MEAYAEEKGGKRCGAHNSLKKMDSYCEGGNGPPLQVITCNWGPYLSSVPVWLLIRAWIWKHNTELWVSGSASV